jgi:hypothetical protein
MRKKIIVLLAVLIALCFAGTAQADLVMYQTSFSPTLIAGNSVTQNITFKPTLKTTSFYIDTLIIPDSFGISVNYSNIPKTPLLPNVEYTIQMHIKTSILLAPGSYAIMSTITAGQEPNPAPPTQRTHHRYVYPIVPDDIVPPVNPPGDEDTDIDDENNTLPPPGPVPDERTWLEKYWVWLVLLIIIVIALLILLIWLRKRRS